MNKVITNSKRNGLNNSDTSNRSLEDKLDFEQVFNPNLRDIINDIFIIMQRSLYIGIVTFDMPVSINGPFGTATPSNC